MDIVSELNDLQIKNAELIARNLILENQLAKLKRENIYLLSKIIDEGSETSKSESESESESEESASDCDSEGSESSIQVAGIMSID